jgi:general secretion pathway protein G
MEKNRGFTLIELIIVFALIGILIGLAIPQYKNALLRAKESVLKENLFLMRQMINQFYTDKWKYPPSLQSLVDEGYLRSIPIDPITRSSESWKVVQETLEAEELMSGVEPGIVDVYSGSELASSDGTFYNTW